MIHSHVESDNSDYCYICREKVMNGRKNFQDLDRRFFFSLANTTIQQFSLLRSHNDDHQPVDVVPVLWEKNLFFFSFFLCMTFFSFQLEPVCMFFSLLPMIMMMNALPDFFSFFLSSLYNFHFNS